MNSIVLLVISHSFFTSLPGTISDQRGIDGQTSVRIMGSMEECVDMALSARTFGKSFWEPALDNDKYLYIEETQNADFFDDGLWFGRMYVKDSELNNAVIAYSHYDCEER